MDNEKKYLSCADCGVMNCALRNGTYPEFCPTVALTEEEINEITKLYTNNRVNKKVAVAAAEVEDNVIKLRKSKIVTGINRWSCDYFYEYNVNFCEKVLTKSQKCAAKPIRYTHLIGGLIVQNYCNIVKNKLNSLIRSMEKIASDA